jgi:hypothetical protein
MKKQIGMIIKLAIIVIFSLIVVIIVEFAVDAEFWNSVPELMEESPDYGYRDYEKY